MYFSVFMPYSSRKIVAAWFWVPFVLVYFLFGARPECLYPALPALAVAAAVMTPGKVRKYAAGIVLIFLLVNQSGFVEPLSLGRARVAGTPMPSGGEYRVAELITELKSRMVGAKTATVALVGADDNFNRVSFNYLAQKAGAAALKFSVYQPGTLGLADFVVYKTGAFNTAGSAGSDAQAQEISRPWFAAAFPGRVVRAPDTSRLVLCEETVSGPPFRPGNTSLKRWTWADLMDEEITLSGFDPPVASTPKPRFFALRRVRDFDVYGSAWRSRLPVCRTPVSSRISG